MYLRDGLRISYDGGRESRRCLVMLKGWDEPVGELRVGFGELPIKLSLLEEEETSTIGVTSEIDSRSSGGKCAMLYPTTSYPPELVVLLSEEDRGSSADSMFFRLMLHGHQLFWLQSNESKVEHRS